MATGRRLMSNCMPKRYKQGTLYPVKDSYKKEKSWGNTTKRKAGHIRKMGQNKVRKQLAYDLNVELNNDLD